MAEPTENTRINPEAGKAKGLTVFEASMFIVALEAGTGTLALPYAFKQTGYFGVVLLTGFAMTMGFTGRLLGNCWVMVLERYQKYREESRYPYPAIGQVTFGSTARILVSSCIHVSVFGVSVVYLLVAAGNVQQLVSAAGQDISFCYWVVVLAAILCPVTYFGAPKDIWLVAMVAIVSIFITVSLAVANIIYDGQHHSTPQYHVSTFHGVLMTIGTVAFSFGGHASFPTVQVDMKQLQKFGRGIFYAFVIILILYLALGVSGYKVYGEETKNNILHNLSHGVIFYIVLTLSTLQIFLCTAITIMACNQELEGFFKVPNNFCIGRVLVRTAVAGALLFVAESVPNFGPVLALLGASTESLTVFVFPPLFYLKLCSMTGEWIKVDASLTEKILSPVIIAVGAVIVVAASYASFQELVTSEFSLPCYVSRPGNYTQ